MKNTRRNNFPQGQNFINRKNLNPKIAFWAICLSLAILACFSSLVAIPVSYAAFPGTNGKIVFVSLRDDPSGDIYSINADGSNLTRLNNNPGNDDAPSVSPDGTKVVFNSNRDGNTEIYVMNIDGSNQVRLTNNPAFDFLPCWSPDGTKIAFTSDRDAPGTRSAIYIMNADGSNPTRVGNNTFSEGTQAWSADGSKFAFTGYPNGNNGVNAEIFVMNVDGSNKTQLTFNSVADDQPNWSADGTKIVFATGRSGDSDIYVMNADGSNVIQLTIDLASDQSPVWSPDGTRIAFYGERNGGGNGSGDIYIMNADGSNQVNITNNPATDRRPSWQPIVTPPPPPVLTISIDVKPGSFPNSINPRSNGVIPVAILTTPSFSAIDVNPQTVKFGVTGTESLPAHFSYEDVDNDGDTDLVAHFRTQTTGIVCSTTSVVLKGTTFANIAFTGTDSIKTVGCR